MLKKEYVHKAKEYDEFADIVHNHGALMARTKITQMKASYKNTDKFPYSAE